MPGGDTALDVAIEVKELGFNPLTVLQLPRTRGTLANMKKTTTKTGKVTEYASVTGQLTFFPDKRYVESERIWWRCC